jgi:hypothetical protein
LTATTTSGPLWVCEPIKRSSPLREKDHPTIASLFLKELAGMVDADAIWTGDRT